MNRRHLLKTAAALSAGTALPLHLLAKETPSTEWTPLFDGKTLDGWTFYQEGIGDKDLHKAVTNEWAGINWDQTLESLCNRPAFESSSGTTRSRLSR